MLQNGGEVSMQLRPYPQFDGAVPLIGVIR